RISGSTTIEPFMKKVAARYKRPKETTITAPGSIGGMNALLEGASDIVMSSSDLLPRHQLSAKNKGIKIKSFLHWRQGALA
ncbi:MAG: substrate-binding domain-containing protein, partial [Bacteroidetes bacterium]|nr:substrate-binding domain-containing protein [Bacteroidota bacterium]